MPETIERLRHVVAQTRARILRGVKEAEAQFITDYEVREPGQRDRALWGPALERHMTLVGRAPRPAVADGGFASRRNERAAQDLGIRHVVLP